MTDFIILAAQRTGVVNALASEFGLEHKFMVPICGKPLLAHVLDVLAARDDVGRVRVSVETAAHPAVGQLALPYVERGMRVEPVASLAGIADSVVAAAAGLDGPIIVTTADNVLLAHSAIDAVLAALADADVAFALASESAVSAAHPEGQKRYYRFRDGGYANCNLYAFAGPHAFAATAAFREGGQFMNNPRRLINAFGLFNILLFRTGLVTVEGAMRRASKRLGVRLRAVPMDDGAQAIDVDNRRTYEIAGPLLAERLGRAP
jgi:CTP:molybdopterin cytidylyltransferase MocA